MDSLHNFSAILPRFGFRFGRNSVHTARTFMLAELTALLEFTAAAPLPPAAYRAAVIDQNCLAKRSDSNRRLTFDYLRELYALDDAVPLFRALRTLWPRDPAGRPLLALLCAAARDLLLRATAPLVLGLAPDAPLPRADTEAFLDALEPGRFSPATLKSTAQAVNGTWTTAGFLRGKAHKFRARAAPTAGACAFALFLGHLTGERGLLLFESEFVRLLDCPAEQALALAELAAHRGWMNFRRVGSVVEASFPGWLTPAEEASLHG